MLFNSLATVLFINDADIYVTEGVSFFSLFFASAIIDVIVYFSAMVAAPVHFAIGVGFLLVMVEVVAWKQKYSIFNLLILLYLLGHCRLSGCKALVRLCTERFQGQQQFLFQKVTQTISKTRNRSPNLFIYLADVVRFVHPL